MEDLSSHSIGNDVIIFEDSDATFSFSGQLFQHALSSSTSSKIQELPISKHSEGLKSFNSVKHISTYYFQGLKITVNLLKAIECLLKLIRYKLLPVLKHLVNNAWLIERVTEKYIDFLSKNDNVIQSKQFNLGTHRLDHNNFERDAIHIIWICHMVDSWAYYNDCKDFGNGSMKDHFLADNFLDYCYQTYMDKSNSNGEVKDNSYNVNKPKDVLSIQINNAIFWFYRMCRTFMLPHFQDLRFQCSAIRRYHCFLAVLRAHPAMFSTIPRPSDIMLVWLAHSLFPRIYRQDVRLLMGHSSIVLLERVLVQPQSYLPEEIKQIWSEMFGGQLIIPGTLHRPLVPHHNLGPCDNVHLLIKNSLIGSFNVTQEGSIPSNEMFLKITNDTMIHIKNHLTLKIPCSLEVLPICVRIEKRRKIDYNVIGFLNCPFQYRQSRTNLDRDYRLCISISTLTLCLTELSYGLRALPELIAEFVEVPPNHNTNLIMFYGTTSNHLANSLDPIKLQVPQYTIAFHFLPEIACVFMFVDAKSPSIVSKLVNSDFLPHAHQLDQPEKYAHTSSDCVTMVVHSMNEEQLIFIINTKDQNAPIKMYIMDPNIACNLPYIELPICTRSSATRRNPKLQSNGELSIQFSHSLLHSPLFPLLLCASLTLYLLNLSGKHKYVQNYSISRSNLNSSPFVADAGGRAIKYNSELSISSENSVSTLTNTSFQF